MGVVIARDIEDDLQLHQSPSVAHYSRRNIKLFAFASTTRSASNAGVCAVAGDDDPISWNGKGKRKKREEVFTEDADMAGMDAREDGAETLRGIVRHTVLY